MGIELIGHIENEADYFAVSCAREFFDAKRYTNKPILILDPVLDPLELRDLIHENAEFTVSNKTNLKALLRVAAGRDVSVHLAVNTGMNRFGKKRKNEIQELLSVIKKSQNIHLVGVFSHFLEANNEKFAKIQYKRFQQIKDLVLQNFTENIIFHLSNSDGVCALNDFDMARVGRDIYSDCRFETLRLSAKVLEIQQLSKGEVAGYSAVFVAKRQTTLAVLGIGYGDGIMRNIVRHGKVLISGRFAKIVAVCMDSMIVDITGISASVGDEAILIGRFGQRQIFVCDVAKWCDTIGYEITTSLQSRVSRKVVE